MQRPVFYAIPIIITAYLPIYTLQSVEGRLFTPMAWTVGFALLGAMIFSVTLAPILVSFLFRKETPEWRNPVVVRLTRHYRTALTWSVHHHRVMVVVAVLTLGGSVYLVESGLIGSEFLPHLDEGAIWVRGTFAPSVGPTESVRWRTGPGSHSPRSRRPPGRPARLDGTIRDRISRGFSTRNTVSI